MVSAASSDSPRSRTHPLVSGNPPAWASSWGQDRYGVWAGFGLGAVESRMRWLPPGSFLMGSPDDEAGRYDDEGPQRRVTLVHGLWLGQVPVTQALWTALGGANPSRFQDPERPVEQVSWDDVKQWLTHVNESKPGLVLRLPSEAEWEYACRAGTMAATYGGSLEIRGESDAPMLDRFAWYGGNSGVGYDLAEAEPSSDWPEKQYAHSRAGTRRVGGKLANGWGLRDMLGNVGEWCEDAWNSAYPAVAEIDPIQLSGGSSALRVVRGGSWDSRARYVRAAYRSGLAPDDRRDSLGFRLARGL